MDDYLALRTRLRSKATKLCNDLRTYRQGEVKTLDQDQLALKIHHAGKMQQELQDVQVQLDKEGHADDTSHAQTVEDEIFLCSRLLARLEKAEEAKGKGESKSSAGNAELKSYLKSALKIPVFHGDVMKWAEFWELFAISVHDNPSFANVQKFAVLKSHLAGVALRAIQGIPVSGEGYDEAVAALRKRFELDDVRRETLMREMLNMPSVRSNDLKGMRSLIDHLSAHSRALGTLGVPTESFSSLLLPIVKDKIPENWRIEWARRESTNFPDFLDFLHQEIRIRESARRGTDSDDPSKPPLSAPSVSSSLNARRAPPLVHRPQSKPRLDSCGACGRSGHDPAQCERFERMPVDARWRAVKASKACFRCLRIGHRARECQADPCVSCGRHHHALLHYTASSGTSQHDAVEGSGLSVKAAPFSPAATSPQSANAGTKPRGLLPPDRHRYNAGRECGSNCFFQTALVEAEGPGGRRMIRILLDGGSDSSYIRSSVAEELGLPITGTGTFSCIGFQEKVEEPRQYDRVRVALHSRFGDGPVSLDMWSTSQLCSPLPATSPPKVPSALPDLMADDFEGGEVDILIGIDNLYHVVLWEQVDLGDGLRAIDTVFGYVVHGRHGDGSPDQPCRRANHRCQVERMWDLETVGISAEESSESDFRSKCQPHWNKEEGRYEMGLAWRSDDRPVANLEAARIRTQRMAGKLSDEKTLLYDEQIREMMSNSVIEKAPVLVEQASSHYSGELGKKEVMDEHAAMTEASGEEVDESVRTGSMTGGGIAPESVLHPVSDGNPSSAFFLPHRGVFRKEKLRIVFDGSAKDGTGKSLNDYLDAGDNLLRNLPAVVLNFRDGAVGSQSDIKAAFHQVAVKKEDRRYLQFFWFDLQLRFARVPFGISCAPYMLLKTIDTHLGNYEVSDPELCSKIRAGTYMDDICTTFSTRQEAQQGMERMAEMFGEANMQLHKSRVTGDSTPDSGVLGMIWSTETDKLAVVVPDLQCPTTKSDLLSAISKTFDPLGVLAPWLIGGKVLFQRLWREAPSVKWDDPLPDKLQKEVRIWWKSSNDYRVWFPRSLASDEQRPGDGIFHVFCDASKQAYCTAVYLVSGRDSRLVIAKSRLAPLNPNLTIPRLELMAALIGARLMSFVKETLKIENPSVTFWTDSTDVLYWLWNSKPRKVFVENRVSAILALSQPHQWRHVKGTENPADLGTRGISIAAVARSEMWRCGPPHIIEGSPYVQHEATSLQLSSEAKGEDKEENRRKVVATATTVTCPTTKRDRLFDITRCSTLKKVVERTAWIKRFTFNSRHKSKDRRSGPLTPEERQKALEFWIREAQDNAYHSELRSVEEGVLLPVGSPLTKLRPQLNEEGILCAIPRTHEPPLPILPEFAHVTMLIIDEAHRRCFHQNTRVTLALLSAEYLVRRRSVKRVVSTCTRCRRYRGLNYQSSDGGLPSFRTEPSRPFAKVGLDFFGPLHVDEGVKVWVLLFTCATSRAIHLELVKSQSTEDVKRALRKFFALRSTPELIFSDNAKTFHALLNHIPRSVTWRFIPEAAPWWGGFWERMVGITKKCLKITLHQCHLTFDELAVTLYELAFHLNLRPLTSTDDELLTPAHLLFGVSSIHGVVSRHGVHEDHVDRAWRHRRRVGDHLIRRWTREYVSTLRSWTVSPHGRPTRLPEVGDVVLVHGDGPRSRWPLARVESLIVGPDGHSRAAHILMRGKRTRRPIARLFQLEAASSCQ